MPKYLLSLALLMPALALAATVYKTTDANGNIVYSDAPAPAGDKNAQQKVLKFAELPYSPLPESVLRYQREIQQGIAEAGKPPAANQVALYTAKWCGYCKQAKKYLAEKNISYQEYDIETPEGAKSLIATGNTGKGVPLMLWKEKKLRGFSAESYDKLFAQAK